jgi:hypothetical protein
MNIEQLNIHYNKLTSFDNDVKSIQSQVNRIKGRVDNVADDFYDFSGTLFKSSGKIFEKSKNEYEIAGSVIVGAAGLATAVIGGTFGAVGNLYADVKGNFLIKKLNSKKEEVALAKICYAHTALKWGEENIDKYLAILKNDLSVNIKNTEDNEKLYYNSRQLAFEMCYKCLFIIKLSQNLIVTYNSWIAKKYFNSVRRINEEEILQDLLYGKNGVFKLKLSKEKFIDEINKQPMNAKFLLLLENKIFFPFIPLTSKEFISENKKLDKLSLAYLSINNNTAYQNMVRIEKENIRKRNKKIILFLLFAVCIFLIVLYWGLLGWWNLLVVPVVILSFLFALAIIHD